MRFTPQLIIIFLSYFGTVSAQVKPKQFVKSADSLISLRLADVAPDTVVLVANKGKVIYKRPSAWRTSKQERL